MTVSSPLRFGLLFTAVMVPMFMASADQNLLAAATPRIAAEFGALADTLWISVGYLIAAVVAAPVYGRLGDRFGHRRVMLGSLAMFCLGAMSCAAAAGMWTLALSRVLQGFGGGGLMVLSQSLIGQLVEPMERPRYQAYFTLVFAVANVGGPALGGVLAAHAGWRWLFLVQLPLCAFAAWRVWQLPAPQASALARGRRLDLAGLLLFAVTVGSALLWLGLVGRRFAAQSLPGLALAGTALAVGWLLWRHQRSHAAPFMPVEVLRLHGAAWMCASVACYGAAQFTLVFLLPIQAQLVRGASAASAGLQLLPLTAGIVIGAWFVNRHIVRTRQPNRLAPHGHALAAGGLLLLAWLDPAPPLSFVLVGVVALGLSGVISGAQLALQIVAGRQRLGAAASLMSLSRSCGGAFGTAMGGAVAFAFADVGLGLRAALALLGLLSLAGALCATRLPRVRLDDANAEGQPVS